MSVTKKLLSLLLTLTMVCSMAACGGDTAETTQPAAEAQTEGVSYTVEVKTQGGMVMPGVDVYVYADSTLSDLKQYGETGENGRVSFTMPESGDYAVVLSGMPEGYEAEAYYSFSAYSAEIAVTSHLISGESLSSATLGLGDVMYDFSVVTPDGETVTLSDMLAEKDMVLLNFWYTTCTYCVAEFPFMEEAYQQYSDRVGIIALNPFNGDAEIKAFQADMGLSFPMASCQSAWATTFSISGYPTSIAVDRYGVICMIEAGGITSLRPFVCMFDHFTGDDYEQVLCQGGIGDLITNIKPTYTMDTSEAIGEAINSGDIQVTYRPETEEGSGEYSWPFIITEKNGETCLKASNQGIEDSFAILYADVTLEAGQALGFDYLISSELGSDILVVIVDGDDIYQIGGVAEEETWESCFPCVATKAGTYELALCYLKDDSGNAGDDTAYIKNLRVVDASEVNSTSYLPREAAITEDGFEYEYVDVVLSEKDGYYHVGTEDGPLLLANLMGYSQFNEEKTVFDIAYDGDVTYNGSSIYDVLVQYCSYASNSTLEGMCTVNEELAELLKVVADQAGFDDDENEWLKICRYYQVYGSEDTQLEDPIKGLAPFSAYEAKQGKNVATNCLTYDRPIMPRGLLAKFVPTASGVYRITSRCDSQEGVDAWIFDENREIVFTYENNERMHDDAENCSMLFYMEAGKAYYIDIAFWDLYETGTIYYDIEFEGATCDVFRLCAPGYFTYDTNATGDAMYYLISGGIKAVLGDDGYYHEDLGLDSNGVQQYGSIIYADFTGTSSLFDTPIATVEAVGANGEKAVINGIIDKGGFDFSKTESDQYILTFLKQNDGDPKATEEYLRALWAESFDEYAKIYQIDDVFDGIYHGGGQDRTEEIRVYLDKIENSPVERKGCVPVDAHLAELLQELMEKFTFANVEGSWMKLCYYYDHLGPNS